MSKTRLIAAALVASLGAALAHDTASACDRREEYRTRRAAIAQLKDAKPADLARAHYMLGLWASENGLPPNARTSFQKALEHDTDHEGARGELGFARHGDHWLTHSESMEAKGLVLHSGTWILREEAAILNLPKEQRELRRQGQAKVRKLLDMYAKGTERARKFAKASLDTIDNEHKLEPLAFALRSRSEAVRKLAAEELGKLDNRRSLRPLLHRAVFDPSEEVRFASIDAAKAIGDANLIAPLVGALGSEDGAVRMNAARSLARAGDPRGVRYLVYRFEARGGGAGRAYSMFANQLTFIQDFDVEVAQTAFIADPVPGIIQDGVVLDVQVVATQQTSHFIEREIVHGALQHLTGATDVANKEGAWAAWYKEHGESLTASR